MTKTDNLLSTLGIGLGLCAFMWYFGRTIFRIPELDPSFIRWDNGI